MKLYHSVPRDLRGEILYPLNRLKNLFPNVFQEYIKNYAGREEVLQQVIPFFECLWNDVLFFSPIHPHAVDCLRQEYGFSRSESGLSSVGKEWFEVESNDLKQSECLVFRHRPQWLIRSDPKPSEYVPFSELSLEEKDQLAIIPEVARWSLEKFRGSALYFGYMPHVLYRGTIGTKNLVRFRT